MARSAARDRDGDALSFAGPAVAVLALGVAFGYIEAAVVVYLRRALDQPATPTFPLGPAVGDAAGLVASRPAGRSRPS